MTNLSKFWPLDYEPEDQIYENPSWDLPGLRLKSRPTRVKRDSPAKVAKKRR